MAFKVQDAFQYGGIANLNDKFVSGKREAYYISKIALTGGEGDNTSDFTQGSVPSGWDHNTSSHTTTSQFTDSTAGDYFLIKGDANTNSYPLRYATAFQGDYIFQLSFYASSSPSGSDWGMCVSDHSYTDRSTTTNWVWAWAQDSSRVAVQNNVTTPTLYGNSSGYAQATNGNVETTAGYKTMHFQHRPSTGYSKLRVTTGSQDWFASGTQLGSTATLQDTIVSNTTTDYWVGIGADNDTNIFAKADAFRFTNSASEFF
tara:strand:- start:3203 stop:3979 length:777 start_codon:yes stop_codon:yes gene_type:complete